MKDCGYFPDAVLRCSIEEKKVSPAGGRRVKVGGETEDLDVLQTPQREGPELRLELRQSGSGVSISCVCSVYDSVCVLVCEIQCRCEDV